MLGNARTERRGPVPALCCAIPSDRRRTRIIARRDRVAHPAHRGHAL